ncbi:MAG TPA: betaine/proline/choline family ABC transporter ATP-binding protein [archaeon]|nr:betaine/proline/choline family ABC transporter ATP-binding protein [archaeon]HUW67515.1 betaine/proline/choline family ABC transporter ATP-binding protein [Candidatus Nanoarchaeia archaeon]
MTSRPFDRIESVRLKNISKKYENRSVVEHINLEIQGGELLILIGPSGSGKTTTLRMINRLIEPDEGIILINGQDIMELDPVSLRRYIGYVIQDIGLFPHMTIKENIGLVPRLEGWPEKRILEKVRHLLDFVSMPPETFLDRYPRQLSGGQKQRVGLARALAMDPPLLLMDEPFGALDPIMRRQLQDEFLRIKQEIGRTIVFVTHDINEAFILGDRIAIMAESRLVQVGTPEELILSPENDLVADIVDSKRKFKHLDTLKVKDLMSPIDPNYLFDAELTTAQAVARMIKSGVELAIVCDGSVPLGMLQMADLLNPNNETLLRHIARPTASFASYDPVVSALKELQSRGGSMAIVSDGNNLSGVFLSNEVLLKLV